MQYGSLRKIIMEEIKKVLNEQDAGRKLGPSAGELASKGAEHYTSRIENSPIGQLQSDLIKMGYDVTGENGTKNKPDGYLGPKTLAAISKVTKKKCTKEEVLGNLPIFTKVVAKANARKDAFAKTVDSEDKLSAATKPERNVVPTSPVNDDLDSTVKDVPTRIPKTGSGFGPREKMEETLLKSLKSLLQKI